jgi:hypothetical protein
MGNDGKMYELVHEVDEFIASIAADHGYLRPQRRRCKQGSKGTRKERTMQPADLLSFVGPGDKEEWIP